MSNCGCNLRQSSRVPLIMPALCRYTDGTAKAQVQDISRQGLFMRLREFIAPCSISGIEMVLPYDSAPLSVDLSIRFWGRTPSGFGFGACITETEDATRQRWEQLYESACRGELTPTPASSYDRVIGTVRTLTAPIQACLESHGFAVARARDNSAALSQLHQHACEVVLADMNDPQLSGVALCRQIRHQPTFARSAVILVTESEAANDILAGLRAGAAYVISRPFSADYCASRVIAAARQSEADPESGCDAPRLHSRHSGDSSGTRIHYLHAPSVLPPYLVHALDRFTDAYFFTKLAAHRQLRKYRDLLTR